MSSKWSVKLKPGNRMDMFCRPLSPGFFDNEPIKCNESDENHSIAECLEFFASYAEPMDVLKINNQIAVLMFAANA